MKKLFALIALASIVVACNEDPQINVPNSRKINIVAMNEQVRTQLASDGLALLWEPNETIGVFGNVTANAAFISSNSTALETTTFSGEITSSDNTLTAYYPYVDGATSVSEIPFTLAVEQSQTNGKPALADNDLKYGQLEDRGDDRYACTFKQCFSLIKFTINVADCNEIKDLYLDNVWMQADNAVLAGEFKLNALTGALTNGNATADNVSLTFTDRPTLGGNAIEAWVLVNPNLPAGSVLNFLLTAVDANGENPVLATAELTTVQEIEAGCAYNVDITTEFLKFATLTVTPNEVEFDVNGGEKSVTAVSDYEITTAVSASWLSVAGSNGSYVITAEPNTGIDTRTATVTFSIVDNQNETISEVVEVTQTGRHQIEVDTESLEFNSCAGSKLVTVTAENSVEASCEADWITVTNNGDGTFTVAALDNSGDARSTTVTFAEVVDGEQISAVDVAVSQAAVTEITLTSSATDSEFYYVGGSINVAIASSLGSVNSISQTSRTTWCTGATTSSVNADGTYTINVAKNSSNSARESTITFTCANGTATLNIKQKPWLYISLNYRTDVYYSHSKGSTKYIQVVQSNYDYPVTTTTNVDWLTVGEPVFGKTRYPVTTDGAGSDRTGVVTFSTTDGNEVVSASINIHQIDISTTYSDNANCYMINSAGTYEFNANVRGNGHIGLCANSQLDPSITPASAALLWQDTDGFISNVTLNGSKISYTANSNLGNAVIAAYDAAGTILWSWHIWGTGGLAQDVQLGSDNRTFLNLNLGATELGGVGMVYQAGRKDPFPSDEDDFAECCDVASVRVRVKKAGSRYYTTTTNSSYGTYAYSYSHPSTFLASNYAYGTSGQNMHSAGDWFYYTNRKKAQEASWGYYIDDLTKTINDPCPAGYKVPSVDDVFNLTQDDIQRGNLPTNYTSNIRSGLGVMYGMGSGMFWTTYISASNCYVVSYNDSKFYPVTYETNGNVQSSSWNTVYGLPVRCVKIDN